jgi:hypothetical protein
MPSAWSDRLLDNRSLAVLSAVGVALVAFPGADLVKNAQAEPPPVVVPTVDSKGPEARHTGKPASSRAEEPSGSATKGTASEPQRAPAKPARDPGKNREFEGCLAIYSERACRREFDAAVERYARGRSRHANTIATRAPLAPLAFEDEPQWVRRLESLAADGVALKRVRTGGGHEWVFGITREGVLGFSFEERREH